MQYTGSTPRMDRISHENWAMPMEKSNRVSMIPRQFSIIIRVAKPIYWIPRSEKKNGKAVFWEKYANQNFSIK